MESVTILFFFLIHIHNSSSQQITDIAQLPAINDNQCISQEIRHILTAFRSTTCPQTQPQGFARCVCDVSTNSVAICSSISDAAYAQCGASGNAVFSSGTSVFHTYCDDVANPTSSSSTAAGVSSGPSKGLKIGLGVGLSIVVVMLTAGLCLWWWYIKIWKRKYSTTPNHNSGMIALASRTSSQSHHDLDGHTAETSYHTQEYSDNSGRAPRLAATRPIPSENDHSLVQVKCLFGNDEVPFSTEKKQQSSFWFAQLAAVQHRVNEIRPISKTNNEESFRGKRVKIAILDTGIELSDTQKAIYARDEDIKYQSWINGEEGGPDCENGRDEVGHGTHLATLLARVAPNATIHVARVFKNKVPDMSTEPKKVARAIRYAVDTWDVDIIVMSFGFAQEQRSSSDGDSMYESIRYAHQKNVTMFAAASNDGNNRLDGVAWPARAIEVLCVHSGTGHGQKSEFTPRPRGDWKIMVLGEHVESAWPERMNQPGNKRFMTGTSCAAPIAAGIAAIVLDCARTFLSEEEWLKLRRVDCMRRVFYKMKHPDMEDYWYIRPWDFFADQHSLEWIRDEIRDAINGT